MVARQGLHCYRLHFFVCVCVFVCFYFCAFVSVGVSPCVCVLFSSVILLCCWPVDNRASLILWLYCCFHTFISSSFCCKLVRDEDSVVARFPCSSSALVSGAATCYSR